MNKIFTSLIVRLLFHKTFFLFTVIFSLFIGMSGVIAQNKLYVKEKSGTQSDFNLSSVRKLTFSNGNMLVYDVNGTINTYALSNIGRLSFKEEQVFCETSFTLNVDTANGVVTFTNTTIGHNKYYWIFDDGNYSNEASPIHKYDKDGIYRVSLTATDTINGCQAKTEKGIIIKASVTEPCRAEFVSSLDTLTKTLTLTNNSTTNIDRYYWEFGDGSLSNDESPSHTYNATGYYTVNLIVIDTNHNCIDNKQIAINLSDLKKPCRADFTYNVDMSTQKIIFISQSEIPVNTKYMWDFNDGYLSTLVNPVHQYANGGYYDVCLTINNSDKNCNNTYCQVLKASDAPEYCQAKFSYSVDTITGMVNFYDESKGKHNGWEWIYGDGTKEKIQQGKHKFTPGYYTAILKISDSETGCVSYFVDVININKAQKLKAGFNFENLLTTSKGVFPVEFRGATYGDASEMEWNFGDGSSNNTSFSPMHEYTDEGTFNTCLKVTNSFTGESDSVCQQVVIVSTDIKEQEKESGFIIYPNPAKQSLVISIKSLDNTNTEEKVTIINNIGQTIFTNYYRLNTNYSINIQPLQSGIYFIKLQSDSKTVVKKFIKE